MSPLRKRMTDEMVLRGLRPRTQESYLCCVEGLARYHGRSPDQLSNGAVTVRPGTVFRARKGPGKTRTGAISGRDREARTVDGHLRARDRAWRLPSIRPRKRVRIPRSVSRTVPAKRVSPTAFCAESLRVQAPSRPNRSGAAIPHKTFFVVRARPRKYTMGRIAAFVTVGNPSDPGKTIECDALVDTGASHMILPAAWRPRLGDLTQLAEVEMEMADQTPLKGVVCGPVQIQIEGFRPVFSEAVFVDMKPEDGKYEPLIGYVVLEQCQAAVDMMGHRLIHVKRLDLK